MTSQRLIVPQNLRITIFIALFAALSAAAAPLVSTKFSGIVEWLIIFALMTIVLRVIHGRLLAARIRWASSIAAIVKKIAEGSGAWRHEAGANEALNNYGEDLYFAINDLDQRVNALRHEKSQAEMVLVNMADGIIATDCGGRITLFNKVASTILNVKQMRALGEKIEDADLHPEVAQLVFECISKHVPLESEIRLPGWQEQVISLRARPFRPAGAEGNCAMVILHDVTEVRRHEKHQKEFVGNVSHELRTPITAIRATAEALLTGAKNENGLADRFLNTIIAESDRLSVLIDDLMEIAKRDAGTEKTKKSDLPISEVIWRVVEVVSPQAQEKNVTIEVDAPETLKGYCDEIQVTQLIRNLVENAVKYTQPGGHVAVQAGETGSRLVISIKDTGIGIPQGEKDRIFERFYRVDKGRSRRLGGTGLGLAIVKEIVEAHDGTINVETQIGRGSTFTVSLPQRGSDV